MNPTTPEPIRSPTARADLARIWLSVSERRGDDAADLCIDQIIDKARFHARFPLTGRPRDDLYPGLRSFVIRPYVVFFRPAGDTIELVHILHHKQDAERRVRETLGTTRDGNDVDEG